MVNLIISFLNFCAVVVNITVWSVPFGMTVMEQCRGRERFQKASEMEPIIAMEQVLWTERV